MQRAPTPLRDGWNTNLFDHFSCDWQLHVFPQVLAELGYHREEPKETDPNTHAIEPRREPQQ